MSQITDTINPRWQANWETGETGWHMSKVNERLKKYFPTIAPEGKRVFVPLCGKTIEMKWLYDQGLTVIGVEGIEKPCLEFFNEHGMKCNIERHDGYAVYSSEDSRLKIFNADFFQLDDSHYGGKFDFLWDRGSLVAIEVADQQKYVNHMSTLVKVDGFGFLEVFEYDRTLRSGQPFAFFNEDLARLMNDLFGYEELERVSAAESEKTLGCNEDTVFYKLSR